MADRATRGHGMWTGAQTHEPDLHLASASHGRYAGPPHHRRMRRRCRTKLSRPTQARPVAALRRRQMRMLCTECWIELRPWPWLPRPRASLPSLGRAAAGACRMHYSARGRAPPPPSLHDLREEVHVNLCSGRRPKFVRVKGETLRRSSRLHSQRQSVSYCTVPPRAHPSAHRRTAGSQSGDNCPGTGLSAGAPLPSPWCGLQRCLLRSSGMFVGRLQRIRGLHAWKTLLLIPHYSNVYSSFLACKRSSAAAAP